MKQDPPARPLRVTLARRRRDFVLAAVSSLPLVLIALAAHNLIPRWNQAADARLSRYVGLSTLRIISTNAVAVDVAASRVRAIGASPFIIVDAPPTGFRVASVEMSIRPALTMTGRNFAMSFMPAKTFAENYVSAGPASVTIVEGLDPLPPGAGFSLDRQLWMVNWTLPDAARTWRIDIPEGADFGLNYVEVRGEQGLQATLAAAPWMMVVSFGATIVLLCLVWQALIRPFVPSSRGIKRVLILALVSSFMVLTILLPPFQGPDENAHWKLGLMFYRTGIAREPAAYYLPETLETGRIAFHPDAKFHAQSLRLENSPPGLDVEGMAALHQYLLEQYPYAHFISYPVMFVVSLVFPTADTVQRALQLFYLCRLVPIVLIVALLYALNRHYALPYSAWFFFSLPLVVQQFVVISADTLLNVGAVIAVFLFLRLRQRPSTPLILALWTLCLTIAYSKFIAAPLLMLPLFLVPYRRLPRPKVLCLLAVLASLPLLYFAGAALLAGVKDVGRALGRLPDVERQWALVGTGAGAKTFLQATLRYLAGLVTLKAWSGPLGWRDTPISPQHLSLIAASGVLAIVLDLCAYGAQLVRLVRIRAAETAVLAGIAVSGLCFAAVADAVLFYLMTTPVGANFITGTQVRHLFPVAIVAVLLPLAVLGPVEQDVDRSPSRPMMIANTVALVLLPTFLLARNIELAFDLLTRYWG